MNPNMSFVSSPTMRGLGLSSLLLGAVALLPNLAHSQSQIYAVNGAEQSNFMGRSVSDAGDVNLDGYSDFLVGEPNWDEDFDGPDNTAGNADDLPDGGRAIVFSGKDGMALYTVSGKGGVFVIGAFVIPDGDVLGQSVRGVGDVNADGSPDFAVGIPGHDHDPDGTPGNGDEVADTGRANVYSGKDGSVLYAIDGGFQAVGAYYVGDPGDVDFDGYPDIIVGAPNYDAGPDGILGNGDDVSNGGRAFVYSGATGAKVRSYFGGVAQSRMGRSQTGLDVNFDGYSDPLLGVEERQADPDGTPGNGDEIPQAGAAFVYSGKDSTVIHSHDGEASANLYGAVVSALGDTDSDGVPDYIVGARWYGVGTITSKRGRAYVYSGKDGSTLHTFTGANTNDEMGEGVGSAGDVNSDGYADIVVGEGGLTVPGLDGTLGTADDVVDGGRASVFSGKDGSTLFVYDGTQTGE